MKALRSDPPPHPRTSLAAAAAALILAGQSRPDRPAPRARAGRSSLARALTPRLLHPLLPDERDLGWLGFRLWLGTSADQLAQHAAAPVRGRRRDAELGRLGLRPGRLLGRGRLLRRSGLLRLGGLLRRSGGRLGRRSRRLGRRSRRLGRRAGPLGGRLLARPGRLGGRPRALAAGLRA